jgi:hypothetical protein
MRMLCAVLVVPVALIPVEHDGAALAMFTCGGGVERVFVDSEAVAHVGREAKFDGARRSAVGLATLGVLRWRVQARAIRVRLGPLLLGGARGQVEHHGH